MRSHRAFCMGERIAMAGVARYEIRRALDGCVFVAFVAANGHTVMTTAKYDTLFLAVLAIEMMREAAGEAEDEVVDLSNER